MTEVGLEVVGQNKIIGIRVCSWCGENVEIRHKKRMNYKNIFCCKDCNSKYRESLLPLNTSCAYCGKMFHLKESKLNRYNKHYCSIECNKKDRAEYMLGEGNHQFGIKGELNSSWKSNERITTYGYRKIRCLEHPFKDCDGFVLEHRLVAEQYLLNDTNSIKVDDKKYLSEEYEVHHIDRDRLNNSIDNLLILTKSEHMKLHMKERFGSTNKEG